MLDSYASIPRDLLGQYGIQNPGEYLVAASQASNLTAIQISAQQNVYQQQVMSQQAIAQSSGMTNATGPFGTLRSQRITEKDISDPMYEVPSAVLLDMWVARFGSAWLTLEKVEEAIGEDRDWHIVFSRLKNLRMLELSPSSYMYRASP